MIDNSFKEWSRLDSKIRNLAKAEYDKNDLDYHNWRHVERMYDYATLWRIPYHPALDFAIAFHDIVYDSEPEKELRSSEFMVQLLTEQVALGNLDFFQVPDGVTLALAQELIMRTAGHHITDSNSEANHLGNNMVMLDLADFTNTYHRTRNTKSLMAESRKLYGSHNNTLNQSISFLSKLRQRMESTAHLAASHACDAIVMGIQSTLLDYRRMIAESKK